MNVSVNTALPLLSPFFVHHKRTRISLAEIASFRFPRKIFLEEIELKKMNFLVTFQCAFPIFLIIQFIHRPSRIISFTKTNLSLPNPLTADIHKKVIHTYTNLQLKAAGSFKYVWPFSGQQGLKCWGFLFLTKPVFTCSKFTIETLEQHVKCVHS